MVNTKNIAYKCWVEMKQRCYNKNSPFYYNYGGRGLLVEKDWINNFKLFINDIGERPSKEYSLDRIDNNNGYIRGNIKWSTKKEQALNRRDTIVGKIKICKNCKNESIVIKRQDAHRKFCDYCIKEYITKDRINSRKFNVSKEELKLLINSMSMVSVGKKFGVSDNAIRKRAIRLSLI